MKIKKIIFISVFIIQFILLNPFNFSVLANEEEINEDYENYSEEYKEYLKLSDEEKENYEVIPEKYDCKVEDFWKSYEDTGIDYVGAYDTATSSNTVFNLAAASVSSSSSSSIPSSYSLITNRGIKINVETQQGGLCWAYASLGALRTHLAVTDSSFNKTTPDLSEEHLNYLASKYYNKGSSRELYSGGNFNYALNYFKYNDGAVRESQLPIGTKIDVSKASELKRLDNMTPYIYVHEVIQFPTITKKRQANGTTKIYNSGQEITQSEMKEIRDKIKKHIMNYGGLYCSIRTNSNFIGNNLGAPYNTYDGRFSQYDDGSISAKDCGGHAVTIVGWDDNYSKNKFYAKNSNGQIVHPSQNGAYLVLNSYGSGNFENGYQWFSYEDYGIEKGLYGYISADKKENYYTYKFNNASAYNKMKEIFSKSTGEIITNDSTKTIKVLDLVVKYLPTYLDLSNLNLTDEDMDVIFKYELPNITRIYINGNNITKIPKINCPKISYLNASNNKIADISNLYTCKDTLTSLNLSNNNIKDTGIMSQLSKLEDIYLYENNIENINSLKLASYNNVNLTNESISKTLTNTLQCSYPSIFTAAKTSGNKLYSSSGLEFYNCKETSDGKGIIVTSPKATSIYVKIKTGNAQGTKMTIKVQDTVAPTLNVTGVPTQFVKSATLKISASDSCTGLAVVLVNSKSITLKNGSCDYTVDQNGKYVIQATDIAGNKNTKEITISKIDNTLPQLTVTGKTNGWTNDDVILTINASDTQAGLNTVKVNDKIITMTNGVGTYTATQNGTYTVVATDKIGNTNQKSIIVNNIDRNAPELTVTGKTDELTKENIVLTIKASDNESGLAKVNVNEKEIKLSNGTGTYTISQNGTYKVTAIDKAGNLSEKEIVIDNIYKGKPTLDVKTEAREKEVILTINVSSGTVGLKKLTVNGKNVYITNNKATYTVTQNGTYTIVLTDNLENEVKKDIVIDSLTTAGDLNKNGKVDTNDLLKIMQHIAAQRTGNNTAKWTLDSEKQSIADVNKDGKIDLRDILKLKRYLAASRSKDIADKNPTWLDM